MHKWLMEQGKCLKMEIEKKGIDNLTKDDLEEAAYFSKVLKNLMCLEKDGKIVEAMEESEDNEKIMDKVEMYEDYPERRYYDDYRYMRTGKYAPKGKGTYVGRRGYDEPMYHMTPDMYREHDARYYRDVDRDNGRMYYTPMHSGNMGMNTSRYESAKRGYEESKMMHKDNTPESKQAKMKDLEMYMKELSEDVTGLIMDATPEEKTMLKNKMQVLMQKIQ